MASTRKITLKSSDGEAFEVDEAVALVSETIKCMVEEDTSTNTCLTLPNVTSKILAKVIEYCKKHVEEAAANPDEKPNEDELKAWDGDFAKEEHDTLFALIIAANYLNIKGLLELIAQAIADLIKDKKPEEIRKIFRIENDFTAEEEEEIRKTTRWAFE